MPLPRRRLMSRSEQEKQRCSFAYGNLHIGNDRVTRENGGRSRRQAQPRAPRVSEDRPGEAAPTWHQLRTGRASSLPTQKLLSYNIPLMFYAAG